MGLSDEILRRPSALAEIRSQLKELARVLRARSAFLVDEQGTPFAALGSVEFSYPHPLEGLASGGGGAELLDALVGAPTEAQEGQSSLMVVRVGPRALLALVLEKPTGGWRRRRAAARARRTAVAIAPLLEGP
jgi:hypothetical protein